MDIEFVRKHHGFTQFEVLEDIPDAGQAVDPLGIVVFGHQLGSLPYPADLVHPAAHRLSRDREAPFSRQSQSQGGATPAGAAPAVGPRGGLEQGQQRAAERRNQHGGAHGWQEPPLVVVLQAQGPLLIGAHGAVHTGAGAKEDRSNLGRIASRGTQQQDMEGQ